MGLMDYHARFYSPYLNRFIQPDSLIPDPVNPQAWNRFSYVGNRPVNFNDPTGHYACGDGEEKECGTGKKQDLNVDPYKPPKPKGNGGGDSDGDFNQESEPEIPLSPLVYGPPAPTGLTLPSEMPLTAILHPLDGNVVSQQPIYDYSHNPPTVIGYRIKSYAAYDYDVDPWGVLGLGLPIPDSKHPISFNNADIVYSYGVNTFAKNEVTK